MIKPIYRTLLLAVFLMSGLLTGLQAQVTHDLEIQEHTEEIRRYWSDRFEGFYQDQGFPLVDSDSVFLSYFEPDMRFKVRAQVEILDNEEPFQMPTYAGTTSEYVRYARAHFRIEDGPRVSLILYQSTRLLTNPTYQNYLFVPFLDATNGDQTYGGGRYLDIALTDIKDGELIIDFNRAYNPLCAYSGGYRCPIPPQENHLAIPIRAGELNYSGPMKERPIIPTN